jgi:hypothetical protein
MEIPKIEEIDLFIEYKLFSENFLRYIKKAKKNKKNTITFDFKDFKFFEQIIKELIIKGYKIQYCKYGKVYAITYGESHCQKGDD